MAQCYGRFIPGTALRLFHTVMDTVTSEFFENYDPNEFQNVEAFLIG